MISSEGGDAVGVHKSANGNNDDGAGIGDGVRATATSPYSSQGSDLQ